MSPEGLNPGDKIIELSAMCRTCAIVSGLVMGSYYAWVGTYKWTYSTAGFFAGGLSGYFVGSVVGAVLFPASTGNVMVAKAGVESLSSTLKGCLVASILTALIVGIIAAIITHIPIGRGLLIPTGISFLIGVVWACLTSLS